MAAGSTRLIVDLGMPLVAPWNKKADIQNPVTLSHGNPVRIGDITVTAHTVDHSGFGAMAFVLEGDSLQEDIEKIGNLDESVLIYSQYNGYRDEPSFEKTGTFLTENGIALETAHTSGHAGREDLERLIKALRPGTLVPIHTFHPGDYHELWRDVRLLKDGEVFDLGGLKSG